MTASVSLQVLVLNRLLLLAEEGSCILRALYMCPFVLTGQDHSSHDISLEGYHGFSHSE